MPDSPRARVVALYLPQFHPTPENDAWWGPGFTEWTNVGAAKPLFPGHRQPVVPADLGYYDLRVPETRAAQAALAQEHGIAAFCYWHYWFGGRRILERPFQEVLESGAPRFPFCLGWANQTWSGIWHGAPDRTLIEQVYPGEADHRAHFEAILPAFRDARHFTVDGKPLFLIYRPTEFPEVRAFTEQWRALADEAGLPGIYFVGVASRAEYDPAAHGLDAVVLMNPDFAYYHHNRALTPLSRVVRKITRPLGPRASTIFRNLYSYDRAIAEALPAEGLRPDQVPCAFSNWDNTPRCQHGGRVFLGATPEKFQAHLECLVDAVSDRPAEHRLVFLRSWNEWAEGNYIEPDRRWGRAYLEAVRAAVGGATNTS